MTAQTRGWGPGWPTDRRADMRALPHITGSVHKAIWDLCWTLCEATVKRGYRIRRDWSWGYANRPIGGTRTASNHSWGLAVDINAPNNPYTSRLVTDMPPWMPAMWKDCGFRWGGDYRGKKDAMHYEYMHRPQDVPGHLVKARRYLADAGGTSTQEDALTPELKAHLEGMEARLQDNLDKRVEAAARSVDKRRNIPQDLKFIREGVREVLHEMGVDPAKLNPRAGKINV